MMDFLETTVALLLLALAFWGFFTDPIGIGTWEAVLPAFLAAFVFLHAISGLFWLRRNDEPLIPVTNATSQQQSGTATAPETAINPTQAAQGTDDQPPSTGATPEQPSAISANQDQASGTTEARDQPPATDTVVDQPSATRAVTEQTSAAEAIEGQSPVTVGISEQLSAMGPTSDERPSGITGPRDQLSASGSTDDRPSATEAITEQSPTTGINSSEELPDATGSRDGPEPSENSTRRFSDPKVCREILMCKMYDESLGPNSLSRVVSRAIPNQRLVHAFDIDNGFTTFDNQYRQDFLKDATKRLSSATKNGWKNIADQARGLASKYVGKFAGKHSCKLEYVVQVVSLKVVFEAFFGLDGDRLNDHPMVRIAQGINQLWIESKSPLDSQTVGVEILKPALLELGLEWTDQKENPLNILLPVYETLWRVVAFCLIEVVFRPSAQAEWLGALEEFFKNPDKKGAFQAPTKGGVSVEFIVKEALRLYPPTKRIYRHFEMRSTEGTETVETVAADIEACHRLPEIWGAESNKYRPARWITADQGMVDAYMPFGGKPFLCPAGGSFGPRMIGVLVAAIAPYISASDWQLELVGEASDCQGVLDDDTELNSKRSGGEQWLLIRKWQSDSGCENDG